MILHYPNVTFYFHRSNKKTTWHFLIDDEPMTMHSSSGKFNNSIERLIFYMKTNFDGDGIPGRRIICNDVNVVVIRI